MHSLCTLCTLFAQQPEPKITKNRALNIFDSPEADKRGWSELGLRIRRPVEKRITGKLAQAYINGP